MKYHEVLPMDRADLARIHRQLNIDIVLPRLVALKTDSSIGAGVEDALEDIRFLLRFQ